MAIGINYESGGSDDIIPIVKYDAKAGRMFRRDRVNGDNEQVDITRSFKAVFDFENLETGHIAFPVGGAPDFALARIGDRAPEKPSADHRPGARILVKLTKDCGGDVRELASTAKAFLRGLDAAHDAYEAGKAANPGKLPVYILKDTVPITSEGGGNKTTNYSPVFELTSWVARPSDLTYIPRAKSAGVTASAAAATATTHAGSSTPPATGSSRVSAPVDAEEDFG